MEVANDTPYRTLLHTFKGHEAEINRIAWSPDGRYLASASFDETVRIWDTQNDTLQHILRGHKGYVYSVAWSPDGRLLASSGQDKTVRAWDIQKQHYLPFPIGQHDGNVYDIAWLLSSSAFLASCSQDQTVRVWGVDTQIRSTRIVTLRGHASEVFCLSHAPDQNVFASGSSQGPVRLWDATLADMGQPLDTLPSLDILREHKSAVYNLAWSPDGQYIASGSEDCTIRIWRFTWQLKPEIIPLSTLEWHTGAITGVSFSHDSRVLASKSRDGTICLWRTDTWERVDTFRSSASNGVFAGIAFHPGAPLLAAPGNDDMVLHVWQVDIPALLGLVPQQPTVYYVNAKVVLAGDGGVGKTGLGIVLAGLPYTTTSSTHGRIIRTFKNYTVVSPEGHEEQREIFLWDLAGQSGSRLVHQLHLPEAALVLIVFSDNEGGDPLSGVRYWVRALRTIQQTQFSTNSPINKLLVEARIDRGLVRLSPEQIQSAKQDWGFLDYLRTSAMDGRGIAELAQAIEDAIGWNLLPKVSSTELFQRINTFLLARKEAGYIIESHDNLYRDFLLEEEQDAEPEELREQFNTCIKLLDAQGLLRSFSFGGLVLLVPEKLDNYASALVNAVRDETDGLGYIAEATILAGHFDIPQDVRLNSQEDEMLLLLALIQDMLKYEIALRENDLQTQDAYLVFPSEVMRQGIDVLDSPAKSITFTFEGPVLNVYATLVVRLAHSGLFTKKALWQNAVIFFSRTGGTCGCLLSMPDQGRGELALFFDEQTSEETRYNFEKFIQAHLEARTGGNVLRHRIFICPVCKTPLSEVQVALGRERGLTRMGCPLMDGEIDIRDDLERLDHKLSQSLQAMDREADAHRELAVGYSILQGKERTQDYDVYFSYNPLDEQAAKEVRELLKGQGYLPWVAAWDLQPGLPRQQQLSENIRKMRAAAVLIGEHQMDRRTQLEIETLVNQFLERGCPVIPVFLSSTPQGIQLPPFLENMVGVDFRKQDPDPLEKLIQGIQNKRV